MTDEVLRANKISPDLELSEREAMLHWYHSWLANLNDFDQLGMLLTRYENNFPYLDMQLLQLRSDRDMVRRLKKAGIGFVTAAAMTDVELGAYKGIGVETTKRVSIAFIGLTGAFAEDHDEGKKIMAEGDYTFRNKEIGVRRHRINIRGRQQRGRHRD